MFDDSGEYIKSIGDGVLGRCFGLATNGKGRLFTINTNHFGDKGNMTEKGYPFMSSLVCRSDIPPSFTKI